MKYKVLFSRECVDVLQEEDDIIIHGLFVDEDKMLHRVDYLSRNFNERFPGIISYGKPFIENGKIFFDRTFKTENGNTVVETHAKSHYEFQEAEVVE